MRISSLLDQIEADDEVVIERDGVAVAKLIGYGDKGKRIFGSMKGVIEVDDSFFDRLPEEELRLWEGGD